jgi:hypothetical protein
MRESPPSLVGTELIYRRACRLAGKYSMVDCTSRFLELTTLDYKPTCGLTDRKHLHICDDDLDLGRAAVDEEFDAVDET